MADNAMMYAAVYADVEAALEDLDVLDQMHDDELIGKFDAAVIDKEEGRPHVVRRVDRPHIRVIPELIGRGALRRHELHDAAMQLADYEAELVMIGEPTLEKAFDRAVTRSARTLKHEFNTATDDLAEELRKLGDE
jgi:hypothetical protein